MKPRPDLVSLGLVALCVLGIVALSLAHVAVPDTLNYVMIGALGVGGGTALNTALPTTTDTAAQRIADSLSSLEQLIGGVSRKPAPAPAPVTGPASVPAQSGPVAVAG